MQVLVLIRHTARHPDLVTCIASTGLAWGPRSLILTVTWSCLDSNGFVFKLHLPQLSGKFRQFSLCFKLHGLDKACKGHKRLQKRKRQTIDSELTYFVDQSSTCGHFQVPVGQASKSKRPKKAYRCIEESYGHLQRGLQSWTYHTYINQQKTWQVRHASKENQVPILWIPKCGFGLCVSTH